ncbi:MAG TPA: hypothetical protein VN886_21165 [Acidimicrobiales bacterium]|jgi:hypothetical protein|nr:hypothetical protein [Acidimicrobiales bacterium]
MRNGRTHLTRLGALALASAATLGAAGVAGASTPGSSGTTGSSGNSGNSDVPSTLAGIKSKANTDITDRVNSLNSAIEKVKAAKGLGSGQGTLEAYLGTDITPLQQLDATIQGETSAQQAAADFRTIFTNFRVYRLVLPGAHIAGDAFRVTTTAVPNLQAASTKAQQYVNPGNQGVLEPLIDDLNGQISAASSATNGLAATVLAYTPQQWNANNNLLAPSKQSDAQADAAVSKGRQDVQQIRAIVKNHVQGSPNSPSAAGSTPTTT